MFFPFGGSAVARKHLLASLVSSMIDGDLTLKRLQGLDYESCPSLIMYALFFIVIGVWAKLSIQSRTLNMRLQRVECLNTLSTF